jgi:hypothetical protein
LTAALPLGSHDVIGKWPLGEVEVPVDDLPSTPPIFWLNVFGGIDVHETYKPSFKERTPNDHVVDEQEVSDMNPCFVDLYLDLIIHY